MFIWYGGRTGAETVRRQIQTGDRVGFDIVASTLWINPPGATVPEQFGMRSANLDVDKFRYASAFQKWTLTDPPLGCGDWGYLPADMNTNCEVDLIDFSEFAGQWMKCTAPLDEACH